VTAACGRFPECALRTRASAAAFGVRCAGFALAGLQPFGLRCMTEPTIVEVEGSAGKSRLGSFLLGGLLGGLAALAASRRRLGRQPARPKTQPGLAAFEAAPCYQELLVGDPERSDRSP
jgi:hypothetical protein